MKKFLIILCALLIMTGVVRTVQAIPLQDLFSGQEIVVDDKRFYDWMDLGFVSTNPINDPDYNLIEVTGISDPLNPGLRFDGPLTMVPLQPFEFLDVTFGFSVEVLDPNFSIKDNSLEITDWDIPFIGLIGITETVTDASGNELAFKDVQVDKESGIFDVFDSAEFAPQTEIQVVKNILMMDPLGIPIPMSLNSFEQRFSQVEVAVPEPGTLLLLAGGIAGLVTFRKKLR
jgi:hypothetical protein